MISLVFGTDNYFYFVELLLMLFSSRVEKYSVNDKLDMPKKKEAVLEHVLS